MTSRPTASRLTFRTARSSRPCAIRSTGSIPCTSSCATTDGSGAEPSTRCCNHAPNLGGGNRYAAHLEVWFDTFGRENVLVTMYDELRDAAANVSQSRLPISSVSTASRILSRAQVQRRRELFCSRAEKSPPRGQRRDAEPMAQGPSGIRSRSICSNATAFGNSARDAGSSIRALRRNRKSACASATSPKSKRSKNCSRIDLSAWKIPGAAARSATKAGPPGWH